MSQHIHILGICGTFMGGLALLARELGHRVTGSDANVYPPMSTQLAAAGITLMEGYSPDHLTPVPDLVIVGNALSRGNPAVEAVLDQKLPYTSGPQWLGEQLLRERWVLAVAGTHGKTTTSSMLAWILEYAGLSPGFLIGGVPGNFGQSARIGQSDFFVIEADEYDTAFFDKRSKFLHYRPDTLVINNLEFDHADIFPDLSAIETQFHHLMRCVPGRGLVVHGTDAAINRVIARGCWSDTEQLNGDDKGWRVTAQAADGSAFTLRDPEGGDVTVAWSLIGQHNVHNACAAIAAARHAGVAPRTSAEALTHFHGVKRRLELRGTPAGVRVFDDFAHHPTAIATTLQGMRAQNPDGVIIAVIEPRSNTMRAGVHTDQLAVATKDASMVFWYEPPGAHSDLARVVAQSTVAARIESDLYALVQRVAEAVKPGDSVVIMSNGGFGGFHERLIAALQPTATD